MPKAGFLLIVLTLVLSGCHTPRVARTGPAPAPVYQPAPPPVYQPAVPPGHGGIPPGQAKKIGPGVWSQGGPPPWAPAHGYRRKQRGGYYVYDAPYGIYDRTCWREDLGRALGAVGGGVAGYQIGKGHGKTAAVIGGAIIGSLIGGHIGRSMDDVDQNCVGQVLEHAPPNQPIVWRNQETGGQQYQVTPSPVYQDRQGRYCREYQTTAIIGGRQQQTYGTACRQPDGSWQIVN